MKKIASIALAALLTSGLSGCVIVAGDGDWHDRDGNSYQDREEKNRALISELTLDESRADVVEKLGVPEFSEAFDVNKDHFRVLYYRTQRTEADGITTKDETTPLVFRNNALIGWGQKALHKIRPAN